VKTRPLTPAPLTNPPPSTAQLQAAAEKARAVCPGATLELPAFAAHLEACGADAEALGQHGADLYLAAACAAADRAALRWFDRQMLPTLDGVLARMRIGDAARDEVQQQLRVMLLTGERTIVRYSGRSSLATWLRSVLQHAISNQRRALASEERHIERYSLDHILVARPDAETDAIKHRYGVDFQSALEDSLAALSARSKEILRLYYLGGLNIDGIAAQRGVHRATAARWLAGIRSVVLSNLRARLATTVRPTSSAFRSLVTVIRDDLELDVSALLEDPARSR
jgi:RNA polymerase sigma-70 factor (ECF subfamily)